MNLTSEHEVGGKSFTVGKTEDLDFIVNYNWPSPKHMKEAIKIFLCARLDGNESQSFMRFDGELTEEVKEVQIRLASNPLTNEEVLDYLAKAGDEQVCERVGLNPRCPASALLSLAKHPEPEVRISVCEHPVCPVSALYALAKDQHPDVRLRLAENPNLPVSILNELAEDENPFVQARAIETIRRSKTNTSNVIEGRFPNNAAVFLKAVKS